MTRLFAYIKCKYTRFRMTYHKLDWGHQQRRNEMIYAYASLTVTDPEALANYREKAGAALAKHGGKVEVATAAARAIDGAPVIPDAAALLSFPDAESALAWSNDPTLADVHTLRRSAGASDIVLLG
jgi:uncharacterized protein (DUF1330 family)